MQIVKTLLIVSVAIHQIGCVVDAINEPLKNISPNGKCDPGELVFVGFCNLCLCNSQGVPNQICAKSWCRVKTPLPPRNRNLLDSSTINPELYAAEGSFSRSNPSQNIL